MKRTFYTSAFIIAAFAGVVTAETPHFTMTNGCVDIKVPTAIHADAVEAGLYAWMDQQCEGVA